MIIKGEKQIKIQVLIENKSKDKNLSIEHGLSLYIETNNLKILFDVGESKKFWKNAEKMGLNLEEIDYLILSHGHKDHGGGLAYFLKKNKKAKIYCSEHYFDKHYKKMFGVYINIGIPYKSFDVERFNFIQNTFNLEDIYIFHCFSSKNNNPINDSLYIKNRYGKFEKDTFKHEINVIIKENDKNTLIVGCAHSGVENILQHCFINNIRIQSIIGGLHLSSKTSLNKNKEYIEKVVKKINKSDVKNIFSCHCTGEFGIKLLKKNEKTKVFEIKTGDKIEI